MKQTDDFILFCADLSLNRSGFAQLKYHSDTRSATVERMSIVNNKGIRNSDKPHGQKLAEIAMEMKTYMTSSSDNVFVREKWVYVKPVDAYALAKVHGISDIYAWKFGHKEFYEVNPITIKKLVTGNGKAKKEEVAAALEYYVGPQEYESDDESDAVACGIAYLIKNHYIDQKPEEQSDGTSGKA